MQQDVWLLSNGGMFLVNGPKFECRLECARKAFSPTQCLVHVESSERCWA